MDKALREAAGKLQGRLLVGVIGSIGVRRDTKAVSLLAKFLRLQTTTWPRPLPGLWAGSATRLRQERC